MRLKESFLAYDTGKKSLLVPTGDAGFSGLVEGNKTLGVIFELLKTETTEQEIVSAMCARFDAPEEVIAGDVKKVLAELREIGALEGPGV